MKNMKKILITFSLFYRTPKISSSNPVFYRDHHVALRYKASALIY